ncbi:myc box-dependent-interacting protein 1 isoform X2 [Ceratina calcarata]|uniref:Myc box-dependent-interacting protein 1 isoform X2 n=1 Tax=Ceratina calcarata TaxID=156304 RepID=A0AAJ7N6K6_9HYME|nr:myc box-dependent-interacting protein 1 isoform X2 [Ceratina calcarata]
MRARACAFAYLGGADFLSVDNEWFKGFIVRRIVHCVVFLSFHSISDTHDLPCSCTSSHLTQLFLQNLGKVDRTADDIFDEHLQNFMRQQNAANRLQKEFNNYIRCVRAVQAASKTLMDSLNEIYESQWTGHDLLYVQAQNLDMLWQDFTHKLADQVLVPLNTYQSQFPEMRKKIDKRGRKLVDYDSQRHNFQSLQCNPRKRDELKVSKGKEMLEEAKRTYEQLNSELHDELPALYDSRVLFLVTNLQTLFAAEQVFHSESAKVYSELEAIVDKLANESQRGSYTLKKNTEPQSPKSPNANSALIINTQPAQNNISPVVDDDSAPAVRNTSPTTQLNGNANSNANSNDNSVNNQDVSPQTTVAATTKQHRVEELYDIPVGATTDNLPPGVLYRVKATYKYRREDADELSFDVGDIIRVVEYDDPEEQEQGWLMGIKEGTNEKGMFPANFTKPL